MFETSEEKKNISLVVFVFMFWASPSESDNFCLRSLTSLLQVNTKLYKPLQLALSEITHLGIKIDDSSSSLFKMYTFYP